MTDTSPVRPTAFQTHVQVVKALILRDMIQRYGNSRMSYLWGLITPVIGTVGMLLIFSIRGRLAPTDLPLIPFVLTGYPLFNAFGAFRTTITKSLSAGGLLMFPQIKPIDLIVSAGLLLGATQLAAYAISATAMIIIARGEVPAQPLGVFVSFLECCWIGGGLGLIMLSVERYFPLVEQWLSLPLRLMMFFSGVIFTATKIPSWLLPYLSWNPVFHCIELARQHWHPGYVSPVANDLYVLQCGFYLTAAGMFLERATRRRQGE